MNDWGKKVEKNILKKLIAIFIFLLCFWSYWETAANSSLNNSPENFEANLLTRSPSKECCHYQFIKVKKEKQKFEIIEIVFTTQGGEIKPRFTGKKKLNEEEFLGFWSKFVEIDFQKLRQTYSKKEIFQGQEIRPVFPHAGPAVLVINYFDDNRGEVIFKLDVEIYDDNYIYRTAEFDPLIDLFIFDLVRKPDRKFPQQDLEELSQLKKTIKDISKGTFFEERIFD